MANILIRLKKSEDDAAVAALICDSLNVWYKKNRGIDQFVPSADAASIFTRVYDALDPDCCVVAEDAETGKLAGSCFFHPRPTHVSLGIMNVAPEFFGQKVGSKLLAYIVDVAEKRNQPLRLVSSAMNLDSFSLYNRAGFVPTTVFQDMTVAVPDDGFDVGAPAGTTVRKATLDDVAGIVALERELCAIDREKDWRFFIENNGGIWGVSVAVDDETGAICGVAASVDDPGSAMVGPGVSRTEAVAAALIRAELYRFRGGRSPVFLIPTSAKELRREMFELGAKNTEIHFAQTRGEILPQSGVVLPSFMPESA